MARLVASPIRQITPSKSEFSTSQLNGIQKKRNGEWHEKEKGKGRGKKRTFEKLE